MKRLVFPLALAGALLMSAAAHAQPGSVPGAGRVELAITLKLRAPDQLAKLIDAQSDPRSPQYAHFLTPAQFRAAFAPTQTTYDATLATLRAQGFHIDASSGNRTLIRVSAPPATVSRIFGARLQLTATRAGNRYIALDPLRVPRELAAVRAAVGAGQIRARPSAGVGRPAAVRPTGATPLGIGPDGGYSPKVLAAAYDFPVLHGFDGSGVKVADTIDNFDVDAEVDTFLTNFGIVRRVPLTTVIGSAGYRDMSQPDIDAEWVLGVAPGVSYYIYDATFLINEYIVTMFTNIVSDNIVDVVNTSFAACETDDTLALALQPLIAQGVAQGIAFEGVQFGTPGTCGINGLDPIMYPGGDPNSLAIGGTNIIADPSYHIAAQSALPGTGGGVSLFIPLPAFQAGISGVNPAGRNTPDLVIAGAINSAGPSAYFAPSNPFTGSGPAGWSGGYPFVNNAPVAGMLAELQQMVHHRLGAFDKTLYHLFAANGYGSVFHDITSGCDGFAGGVALCARPGYDVTSGIGSVDVYALGKLLH